MKLERLKKRLTRDRPMTTVSIRFPVDVIGDLKRVAPLRGFSGYQPLVRAYVGQGLRVDLERLENDILYEFPFLEHAQQEWQRLLPEPLHFEP